MTSNLNSLQGIDFRFERKYLTEDLSKERVEFILRNHSEKFSEIYHQRIVNNIYFDTLGMTHYYDNIDGNTSRRKYRIRWYGDLFGEIKKPVLEIKIKEGAVGRKESYPLKSFFLDKTFNKETIQESLSHIDLPENVKHDLLAMKAVLLNRYTRKYYLSFNKLFRATLDYDLTYYRITYSGNTFLHKTLDTKSIVLELKYSSVEDMEARKVLDFSPLAVTKSSKYVQGFEHVF